MRTSRYAAGLIAAFFVAGCGRQAGIESEPTTSPVTPADTRALPPGTQLDIELDKELGTEESHVGEVFSATVIRPVVATTGEVAVPVRTKVYGRVTGLDKSDHIGDAAAIKVDWDHIEVNGQRHMLDAQVTDTDVQTRGGDTTDETLRKAGIGAAAGAVLGAVLSGGDLSSILKGGAIGAAAGTVISLGMGNVEAVLPVGTRMQLETTRTIDLRSTTPRR
jgi:hypothetical protein